jgi:hypothetical protein
MWVIWNLISVRLEIVLVLCKIGALFVPNVPYAWKSFWTHTMELLGDVGHVESCFGLFGDSANLDARQVHGLHRTYHMLKNRFRCMRWYSKVMRLKRKLMLVRLKIVLIVTQDRCTVCSQHTKVSEIVLHTPHEIPR